MAVDPEVVLAERELARRNLVDYMQYIFKYAELYRSLEFKKNWHHELIAEALEMLRTGEMSRIMLHMPPGYGKCIHPKTKVYTGEGIKMAEEIRCGDMLWSFKNGHAVLRRCTLVEPARKYSKRVVTCRSRAVIIGHDHPMLTDRGWLPPDHMEIGDSIAALAEGAVAGVEKNLEKYGDDFYWDRIEKIEDVGATDLMHIGVEETHNFIANGLVSHNTEEAVRMWVSHTIGRFPWHKFIHTTYAADLAVKNSVDTKSIMRDPAYQALFPKVQIDRAQDEKHFWRTKEGGGMYAVGTGGAVTGFHAHTIIMDDPVKAQEAHSQRANKEAFEGHYRGAMLSRLQDKKKGGILIIMQRLSDIDLAARIMKENPDEYEVISLPAIEKRPKIYEIGSFRYERAAGEPLFPEWEDLETLERTKRSLGTTTWSAQYMQEPERVEEGFYTDDDFVTVTDFEIPEQNIGIIVDPADSSADAADNRAIGVYGTSVDEEKMERIVVHDGWFGTWNPTETIEWVIYAMVKYPDAPVFIFNLGGGYTLEHNLKKEVLRRNAKLKAEGKPAIRNRVTIIKHKNVRNEKNAKIEGMQPYFQMHQIQFRREANPEFIGQMKKELKSFNPEKDSPKDDCMETLAEFVIGGHVPPKGVAREKPQETSRRKKRGGGWRV